MREYIDKYYPPESEEVNQGNLDSFFSFMNKRHLIWHRRFVEKLPREQWTDDEILKYTKYTNIYRELDRGTLWWLDIIGKEYLEKQEKTTPKDGIISSVHFQTLLWKTVIYRLCNRLETFEECGFPDWTNYDSNKVNNEYWQKLEVIRNRGESVMTSAHLTCPSPAGYTKIEGFVLGINSLHKLLEKLVEEIPKCKSSKEVFSKLLEVHCVGNFTAYEVLCDLMYLKVIGKDTCIDETVDSWEFEPFKEDDFANVGPGAYQGIRLIYPSSAVGRNKKKGVYQRMLQLRDEQHEHFKRLGIEFKWYERFTKGHLSLRSIEHSLCEFSKYWLQGHNLGKQRMVFKKDGNKSVNGKKIIVDPDNGEHIKYIEA